MPPGKIENVVRVLAQAHEGSEGQLERQSDMDELTTIEALEAQLQEQATLFYNLHHQEAVKRRERQTVREELARVLAAIAEAQVVAQTSCSPNVLAALRLRSVTLKHQFASISVQIDDLSQQAELAEDSYEHALQHLESLTRGRGSEESNGSPQ
ncbi:MAG TPA: hypothetical protein VH540_06620 [Ktedonobacterales bacterium]|jgi:hypothetical protein